MSEATDGDGMQELCDALTRATRGLNHISASATEWPGPEGGLCITLGGQLDSDAASALMNAVIAGIETWTGQRRVVVDLAHLEYIASLGIGLLTMAAVTARRHGISLSLHAPQPAVFNVLDILGIPSYIPIVRKEP